MSLLRQRSSARRLTTLASDASAGVTESKCILEILRQQICDIGGSSLVKDTEKICAGSSFTLELCVKVLEKGEEHFIADFLAQSLEEAGAGQIHLIPVGTLTTTIVNGCIHITCLLEFKITVTPPPVDELRVLGLIIDMLTVGGECLIEPRLERLVICHAVEPPLMGGLVCGNEDKIIFRRAIIQVEIVAADEIQTGVLHAIVEIALHGSHCFMAVRSEEFRKGLQGIRRGLEHRLAGRIIDPKVITIDGNIADGSRGDLEEVADGQGKCAPRLQHKTVIGCRCGFDLVP